MIEIIEVIASIEIIEPTAQILNCSGKVVIFLALYSVPHMLVDSKLTVAGKNQEKMWESVLAFTVMNPE